MVENLNDPESNADSESMEDAKALSDLSKKLRQELRGKLQGEIKEEKLDAAVGIGDRLHKIGDLRMQAEMRDSQKTRTDHDALWSQGYRRYFQVLAPLAIPLTLLVGFLFLNRSTLVGGGTPLPGDAVDRLAIAIERLGRTFQGANTVSGWPVWATVIIAITVVLGIGAVLVAIFRKGDSDALTKILSTAIVSIGGLFALSKVGETAHLPASWGDAVHSAILATLVCVGLAVMRPEKGTAEKPPTGEAAAASPPLDNNSVRWLGLVAAVVVILSVSGLVAPDLLSALRRARPGSTSSPPSAPVARIAMEPLGEVGPFPLGVADPDDLAQLECGPGGPRADLKGSLNKLVTELEHQTKRTLDALVLVASADRHMLQKACLRVFKSNRELAQKRGEWVATQLKARMKTALGPVTHMVIVGGPNQFGTADPIPDRSVMVLAWSATPTNRAQSSHEADTTPNTSLRRAGRAAYWTLNPYAS